MSYNPNNNTFDKCKAINTSGKLVDIVPNKTFRNGLWIIKKNKDKAFSFKKPQGEHIALQSYGYTDKSASKYYFTQEYNNYGTSIETLKIYSDINDENNRTWKYNSV